MIRVRAVFAAVAVLGLTGCASTGMTPDAGATATTPSAADGFYRFNIGQIEAAVIHDGSLSAPNDGKTVWSDPGPDQIGRVLAAAGLPTDKVSLDIDVLLVRTGNRIILVDSGYGGASPSAGRLQANLAKAGVTPDQVTDVVISHGHGDHVGGLTTASGGAAFPKARVHMTADEWNSVRAKPENAVLVQAIGARVAPFSPGARIAPGVTAVEVRGHTPGHTAVQIESQGQRLLAIGDSAHHYVVSLRQPEYTITFDRDAPTAEASRRALLQRVADQRLKIFAPHFPYPGLGYVRREGDGFAWTPAP